MTLPAALAACGGPTPEKKVGWQPLQGTEHKTPNYWIPFWWLGPAGGINTPDEAGVEIERLYSLWMAFYKEKWADKEDWELIIKTYKVDIQLFPDYEIPASDGDLHSFRTGIWWYDHNQVDVAMAAPYHFDWAMGRYSEGLEVLLHEWTHCVRGAFHA